MSKVSFQSSLRSASIDGSITLKQAFEEQQRESPSKRLSLSQERIKKRKRNTLIAVLYGLGCCYCVVLMVASILPQYVEEHYDSINLTEIGMIISVFELASFISSPIIGKYLRVCGKRRTMMVGLLIVGLGTIFQGVIALSENQWTYYSLSLVSRFFQGIGDGLYTTACLSLITSEFPDEQEKYLGKSEAAIGVGLLVGPVLASFLYSIVGYIYTYVIVGIILILSISTQYFMIPADKFPSDKQLAEEKSDSQASFSMNQTISSEKEVAYSAFLKNYNCLIILIGAIWMTIFQYYLDGIIAVNLEDEFNIDASMMGYIFIIPMGIYILTCPLVSKICEKLEPKFSIVISFLIVLVGLLFSGPSQVLRFPNNLYMIIAGYTIFNIGGCFFIITALPMVIEVIRNLERLNQNNVSLNDKASGIFNSFYGIGAILAPALGGFFDDLIGYRLTSDLMALFCVLFLIVFVITNTKLSDYSFKKHPIQEKEEIQVQVDEDECKIEFIESEARKIEFLEEEVDGIKVEDESEKQKQSDLNEGYALAQTQIQTQMENSTSQKFVF